jgi:DNA adenine methylase
MATDGNLEDSKLEALRASLGEAAWVERLSEAKTRETRVLEVLRRIASGTPRSQAIREVGPELGRTTLATWMKKYEEFGLLGLVSRAGHIPKDTTSPELRKPPRTPRQARSSERARSFVKWAGAKTQLLDRLLPHVPRSFQRYYEPMVGSGVLFFAVAPERALLADTNAELINCYRVVRDQVDALIDALRQHHNTYEHYIRVRAQDPDELPEVERAARTIFLNKTCFNGLYRVNCKGRFNVPYGRIPHANFVDVRTLTWASERLREDVHLVCADYEEAVRDAGEGDFVYLDPPYAPDERAVRSFANYQAGGFAEAEQRRLAGVFRDLCARGCAVLLSNSESPMIRDLYEGFTIETMPVRRKMSAKVERRSGWSELLISSEPVEKSKRRTQNVQLDLAFTPVVTRDHIHREVAAALDGHGLLPEHIAVKRVAEHLRRMKLVSFERFLPGSQVELNVRTWIDESVREGLLLREGPAIRSKSSAAGAP